LTGGALTEEFEAVLLNLESGASRRLRRYRVNAAVTYICGGAALKADEMVMMRWFARDVGVAAIGKVESLHKALFCKKFKEAEDGGATDPEAASFSIIQELRRREVTLAPLDQLGELAARSSEAYPRLIQRVQHLRGHKSTLS
jgi:hypothetical protein